MNAKRTIVVATRTSCQYRTAMFSYVILVAFLALENGELFCETTH